LTAFTTAKPVNQFRQHIIRQMIMCHREQPLSAGWAAGHNAAGSISDYGVVIDTVPRLLMTLPD
jgi:hypothetical protein